MHSLYLLSLLLTADHDRAEQCLVSAMGECVEGIGVFMDWARSRTRAAVIKHAIQMIKPAPEHTDSVSFISQCKPGSDLRSCSCDEECAILLKCSRRDVMMARLLALKRQSSTDTLAEAILQS